MKKKFVLSLVFAVAVPFGIFAPIGGETLSVQAATAKQWLPMSSDTTYYGQVANGQPHGQGTIKWGKSKQYSGSFINGKRSGTGKYRNTYTEDQTGRKHIVMYNGAWSGDAMNGKGTWTELVTEQDNTVISNEIQTGVFQSNKLSQGYKVIHALADPDYSFSYQTTDYHLDILGSNINLVQQWKEGTLFDVQYRIGAIHKSYSLFQGDTAAQEKTRLASLTYLQSITSEVTPILVQFHSLSKRVPL